jgi:hypothetical protein
MFVMLKCGVLFEVRTEFLNIIYTGFGFKGFKASKGINLEVRLTQIRWVSVSFCNRVLFILRSNIGYYCNIIAVVQWTFMLTNIYFSPNYKYNKRKASEEQINTTK